MVGLVPVADQQGEISSRGGNVTGIDGRLRIIYDAAKSTCSFVEGEGREVEEATNLVLDLHDVCEVSPRRDWTVGARNTILP